MDVTWVANRFATEIVDRYIFPDTATQIAETHRARAGQIPPDTAPAELAALLTQWAFEASNDRHVEVRYPPARPDQVTAGNATNHCGKPCWQLIRSTRAAQS